MPTKKNKVRDLKPAKDAKGGGGGHHYVQGGGSVDGGRGATQGLTPGSGASKGSAGKIVNPNQTEGGNWGAG
jgi:hypothetical protein